MTMYTVGRWLKHELQLEVTGDDVVDGGRTM